MNSNKESMIVVTDGYWNHIRHTEIYHRRFPEIRGEGRSLADAASRLITQLTRGLECVLGRERAAVEQAIAEVRAIRTTRRSRPPGVFPTVT